VSAVCVDVVAAGVDRGEPAQAVSSVAQTRTDASDERCLVFTEIYPQSDGKDGQLQAGRKASSDSDRSGAAGRRTNAERMADGHGQLRAI
jgi:hypothetical protein